MQIGGFDLDTFANGISASHIVYLDVITDLGYWAVQLNQVLLDTESISFSGHLAILDTGSSLILGPQDQIDYIFAIMQSRGLCFNSFGILICSCEAKYPTIIFNLQGNLFEVNQSQYFYPIQGYCLFLVSAFDADIWILGDVFLRNFYAIYDMDNKSVGLVDLAAAYGVKH